MVQISIKSARIRKKMTQAELAKAIGVHQTCVLAWERGKWNPRAEHLKAMSKVLGVSVDKLLSGNDGG